MEDEKNDDDPERGREQDCNDNRPNEKPVEPGVVCLQFLVLAAGLVTLEREKCYLAIFWAFVLLGISPHLDKRGIFRGVLENFEYLYGS
jgi:hypothetical protein